MPSPFAISKDSLSQDIDRIWVHRPGVFQGSRYYHLVYTASRMDHLFVWNIAAKHFKKNVFLRVHLEGGRTPPFQFITMCSYETRIEEASFFLIRYKRQKLTKANTYFTYSQQRRDVSKCMFSAMDTPWSLQGLFWGVLYSRSPGHYHQSIGILWDIVFDYHG